MKETNGYKISVRRRTKERVLRKENEELREKLKTASENVLADSLKESLKEAHKYIVFGTGASLFLLLLLAAELNKEAVQKSVNVPLVGVGADRWLAIVIAGVAFFISGYLAYLAVSRAKRIMRRLDSSPQLREAVLMYPSIPTIIISGIRLTAVTFPLVIFLVSTVPILFVAESKAALIALILFSSAPYLLLIQELWYPMSVVKYKLTGENLKKLLAIVETDDERKLVNKLEELKDKEYPNRDKFRAALHKTTGNISPQVERLFLYIACEEEGIEN